MEERPVIPPEILEEIGLREPKAIKRIATLIQDKKHTKQFSLKFPAGTIEEIGWEAGDKIEIKIESDGLKLQKAEETD
jgi:bifunctional DNA-binding transcriptional regulator/antitoxin component of YhaV-PrlF toxin-antitoxin module